MSLQEIQDLYRRLEEEQRLRKEAEEELRIQTQNTTLPEFLDACHVHLFLGLTVDPDKDSSAKGDPANADHKLRPAKIREWINFPQEQISIWGDLMNNGFVNERHFTPSFSLSQQGKEARERMVRSKLDLSYFQRQTVETPVASVVRQLHANPQLRQIYSLHGDVTFENHANTLTDERSIEEDMDSLSLNHTEPRRSSRLATKLGPVGLSSAASAAQPTRRDRNAPRPRRS